MFHFDITCAVLVANEVMLSINLNSVFIYTMLWYFTYSNSPYCDLKFWRIWLLLCPFDIQILLIWFINICKNVYVQDMRMTFVFICLLLFAQDLFLIILIQKYIVYSFKQMCTFSQVSKETMNKQWFSF